MAQGYQRWEYMVITEDSETDRDHQRELDRHGREGWELVGMVQCGVNANTVRYVFKRPDR